MGSEVSQLGTEVIECLHWRIGALLYMYSHMVLTVEERKKKVDVEHFKEVRDIRHYKYGCHRILMSVHSSSELGCMHAHTHATCMYT